MIVTKRAYEPAAASDGFRVLIDRLWPRGVSKAKARLNAWEKDIDDDGMALHHANEIAAGELAAPIGLHGLGRAVFRDRFFQRCDGVHRRRGYSPAARQDVAGRPVEHYGQKRSHGASECRSCPLPTPHSACPCSAHAVDTDTDPRRLTWMRRAATTDRPESAHHPWRSPVRTTRFNRIHSVGPMHTYLLRVNAFPEWTTIAGSPG
jgi:hypothetical protein